MATVAVTGGTGYTGRRLVDALIARGYCVRALARPHGAGVLPLSVETVIGDLSDAEALARLVRGASVVVHVAAVYRTASHSDAYYRAVNVEGSRRLAEAAAAAGVARFVHTSTVGVHGDIRRPPADETAPLRPGDVYQRTKLDGERVVLEVSARTGLPYVVLRPAGIYGPGDRRHLKLFRAIARGRYAVVGSGRAYYHPVFIDDLVAGFLLAITQPEAAGETFILAGPDYVTQEELAGMIARHTSGRVLPFRIPAWPMQLAGALCEKICVPIGLEPPLHRRRVDFWTKSRAFSIARARRVLGYSPGVAVEDGIARTARWYMESRLL